MIYGPLGSRYRIGALGSSVRRTSAATTPLWLAGGISSSDCISAYQAKGAASYVASKSNLANPGTYDLTDGATYPAWAAGTGWTFTAANNQRLVIGGGTGPTLKPFTLVAGINRSTDAAARSLIGSSAVNGIQIRLGADHKLAMLKEGVGAIVTGSLAVPAALAVISLYYSAAGVYGIYVNSALDSSSTNNQTITSDSDLIGTVLTGAQSWGGVITALFTYSTVINEFQIVKVSNSIEFINNGTYANLAIFDGNSMTDSSYPATTLASLTGTWYTRNFGVSGQTTPKMTSDAVTQIDPYYDSRVSNNVVVAWEGTNDLKLGATATTAYNNLVAYCQARQAAGFKVVILTILPRSDSGTPADFNTSRATVNTNIKNNYASFADVVADVAANTDIGEDGDSDNTTYYSDKVHLTTAGYNIVAGIVATAIQTL